MACLPDDDAGLYVGGEAAPLLPLPLPHQPQQGLVMKQLSCTRGDTHVVGLAGLNCMYYAWAIHLGLAGLNFTMHEQYI